MIERLQPATRLALVQARCLAMQGQQDAAIAGLDRAIEAASSETDPCDAVAIAMLKAEILHLDYRDEEALRVFASDIRPRFATLPPDIVLVAERNENDIKSLLFLPDSTADFYRLVDRQRQLGIEWSDAKSVLAAQDDAAAQKHFNALPAFWRELLRSYRSGCWVAYRLGARRFATECLDIGLPQEAAYHAMIANSADVADRVGKMLLAGRDPRAVAHAVQAIVQNANLLRHFSVACKTIEAVADAIPEEQLATLFLWLIWRAALTPNTLREREAVSSAWKALGSIVRRLDAEQSKCVVDTALGHSFWNTPGAGRKELVEVVNRCLERLDAVEVSRIADQALRLVIDQKHNFDYVESLNLLCHVANLGDANLRERIVEAVYPKGGALNFYLVQAAPILGKLLPKQDAWEDLARRAAENIRLQVQRLTDEQEPAKLTGSLLQFTHTDPGKHTQIVVNMVQTSDLSALAVHRDLLTAPAMTLLVDAALEMIGDSENFLTNRTALVTWLPRVADRVSEQTAQYVIQALEPIAAGQIVEPTTVMSSAQASNPLNPDKINTGSPAELRGVALWAVAAIAKEKPGLLTSRVQQLLGSALGDSDSAVRSWAFAAAREMPDWNELTFTALVLGTRDPDEAVATSAFHALASKRGNVLGASETHWHMLISAITMSLHTSAASVRRSAAAALENLKRLAPSGPITERLEELQQIFLADIAYSVRSAARGTPVGP